MKLRALWTEQAEAGFSAIVDYLDAEWGHEVAHAFVAEVQDTIRLLEVFPKGGIIEVPELKIRSIPVAQQVRLFYTVHGGDLLILEFIDTRTKRFQDHRLA